MNQFITVLNKAYMIHVTLKLATYPILEAEFVHAARPWHFSADGRFQAGHIHHRTAKNLPYSDPQQPDDQFQTP